MEKSNSLQVLTLAMEREKGGHDFYLDVATKTNDPKGKSMFEWLARQEMNHYQKLSGQREALAQDRGWQKISEPAEPALGKSEFPQISEVSGEVKANTGELDALKVGIEAEKESIALYHQAANDSTNQDAKEMFLRLVEEEQGHLELLETEYEWLRQAGYYFTVHRFTLRAP